MLSRGSWIKGHSIRPPRDSDGQAAAYFLDPMCCTLHRPGVNEYWEDLYSEIGCQDGPVHYKIRREERASPILEEACPFF